MRACVFVCVYLCVRVYVYVGAVAIAPDHRLRGPEFESCAVVSNHGQVYSFYLAPVHSAVQMITRSAYRQWWQFVCE